MAHSYSPNLSLCMIVRDESRHLAGCLASARGLADEIVVVDTGSVDDTAAIARVHGARVIETVWAHDFSRARNLGLAEARGRWILVLDADEALTPASVAAIRRLVAGPARTAYNLVQKNLLGAGGHVSVHIVRLFPRHPRVRFERPIHEQVNTSLEREGIAIMDTDIDFVHTGYADATAMPAKTERNRRIIEEALVHEPDGDPNLRYFYASSFFDTGDFKRAAGEYEVCVRQCAGRRRKLEQAARLKAAEAYVLGGAPERARPLLPTAPQADAHPLACELCAQLAASAGQADIARRWREILLKAADSAHLPPVALAPMKLRALTALAEAWAGLGRKDAAVRVLRLGLEISLGRRDGASAEVAAAYAVATGRG